MKIIMKVIFLSAIILNYNCQNSNLPQPERNAGNKKIISTQQVDSFKVLNNCIESYNKTTVLQAIFSIEGNTIGSFVPNRSSILIVELNSLIEQKKEVLDSILYAYEKHLTQIDIITKEKKISRINSWCSFFFIFRSLNHLDYSNPIFFEEILFDMPKTKFLFRKYLQENSKRDWGSLDVNESILLFYDFYKYLTTLNTNQQILIISEYTKEIQLYNK